MVHQQKNRQGVVAARVLAELLGDAVQKRYALNALPPTLIVPVPLHWRREWQRGYNQSALLAHHLGKRLRLPVAYGLARRKRATQSQQQLDLSDREANMRDAFTVRSPVAGAPPELANRRVAIVDDVVTTGATARALAQALLSAGAAEVHLWSPTRAILQTHTHTNASSNSSRSRARQSQ